MIFAIGLELINNTLIITIEKMLFNIILSLHSLV